MTPKKRNQVRVDPLALFDDRIGRWFRSTYGRPSEIQSAVWPAIAEALGKVGTAAAVAPLRTMASRYPFDLGLRRASRQAIAEIQSRLTGATPGQLALADGDAGQLSLTEDGREGRVSLAGEPEASTEGETQWPTDAQGGPLNQEALESPEGDDSSRSSARRPANHRETD
jgi:hypothetical protein